MKTANLSPSRIIVGSFIAAILFGAFLLMLPFSTVDGKGLSFVNALFTATSATCVTGLVVVDTGKYLTHFGQIVVLLLIQAGGLGIMTLSAFFAVAFGYRMSLRGKLILQDALNYYDMDTLGHLLIHIFLFTAVIEGIGFFLLLLGFLSYGIPFSKALYSAFFHSISAFCNAGFSLYSDSLSRFVNSWDINLTVCFLIVSGGIGFPVLYDVYRRFKDRNHLSFHSKVALTTTAILIVLGALGIAFFEWDNVLAPLSYRGKFLATLFQSITPRTAGFNTVDIGSMKEITWLWLMVLMFIGASPGGTGGGIKTTTFVVVLLSVFSTVRNRRDAVMFKHRLSDDVIHKSVAIMFLALLFVLLGTMAVSLVEKKSLVKVAFEVFSAFGTVGLRTGITPSLHPFSKVLLSFIMLVGRVGPLTAVVAMAEEGERERIRYPEGNIIVG